MNPDTTPKPESLPIDAAALRQLARVAIPVAVTTAFADFLFWGTFPGLNVGVFLLGLSAMLFGLRREKPLAFTWLLAGMLVVTSVQSAIEFSLSNLIVGVALLLALVGDAFQSHLAGLWPRFSEALFALITPIQRWAGVAQLGGQVVDSARNSERNVAEPAAFVFKVLFPAAALLVVFGGILAAGNAAFNDLLFRAGTSAWVLWMNLDVTFPRILWWVLVATLALGLLHGTRAPDAPRWWTWTLPRIPRDDGRLARWQTGVALLAMNALFFLVNTLDAIFLWGSATIPEGVSHSEFVHSGVNSLSLAVVLSAVVIAGMFQQAETISGNRWLQRLAHLWVVQNFLLIGGVLRRLIEYAQVYQLTEKRVYVACFLLLVSAGFVLLAWFIHRRRSFNWLLGRNAIATFGLFFILQFIDVRGAVARYNVDHWLQGGSLDIDYLGSLGPNAVPELIRVVGSEKANREVRDAANFALQGIRASKKPEDWRSYQYRETQGQDLLANYRPAR